MEEKQMEVYAKKQYRLTCISTAACVLMLLVVLVSAVSLVPKAVHTFEQADVVMADLEVVTSELAETLPELLREMDALVNVSGEGVAEAMEKISSIDIEGLNEAIGDLGAIVEPMARFFGRK